MPTLSLEPAGLARLDKEWAAHVRAHAAEQHPIHTATLLPLERLAVAPRIPAAPLGLDDPAWEQAADAGPFFHEREEEGFAPGTEARLAFDETHLYVRFECAGAPGRTAFETHWYNADTVELFLDPAHDHRGYFQFAITAGGHRAAGRATRPLDSMRWENKRKAEAVPDEAWRGEVQITREGWRAQFAIPLELLGRAPGDRRPLGLNLGRGIRKDGWSYLLWNATGAGPHAPWGFGQLVLGECPAVHAEQIDLGELRLWQNRGTLWLRNLSGQTLGANLTVRVANGEHEEEAFFTGFSKVPLEAASERQRLDFAFPFNPEDYRWQHLHLDLRDEAGASLWSAAYRFGRGQGWLLQLDDRRDGPPCPSPAPGEIDFMRKKRAFIMRRLPRFVRLSTAQGAPSDFTLQAEDGSVAFNLMRPGELRRIAEFVYARFENDVDRLLGALFFVHQPAVMTYANRPSELAGSLGALSVLRMGCGQCCCFAAALCGVVERMPCEETGRTYRATRVCVPGHVTTVVEYRGKRVHLDPSLGRFYYLRDDRTLASMEDLLADPSLAARAGRHLDAFHRKAALNPEAPTYYPPERGVWPHGAPAE
ncbi:MAG: hypothetical protein KIS92_01345 [Planctomycetota bacterium]|nr:hypothetical protein [Planctomycetota bacterium]